MLERFKTSYDEAIHEIKLYLDDNSSIQQLTHWLLTTDANPYSFLPHAWGKSLESADRFVDLLNTIEDNLENNRLTIVRVNQEPRIVFAHPNDPNFNDLVLTPFEHDMQVIVRFGHVGSFTIEVLDIDPNEFGAVYDQWFETWLKQSCTSDANKHGVEFALTAYSKYRMFNPSWIENEE